MGIFESTLDGGRTLSSPFLIRLRISADFLVLLFIVIEKRLIEMSAAHLDISVNGNALCASGAQASGAQ